MTAGRRRNWAGNLVYSAAETVSPTSVEELAAVVSRAARIKPFGTRHSFNAVADTDGVAVSVAALPPEVSIDPDRGVVRAAAGLRYGDLAARLERDGWALANLASLPHISLAGAVATGTHGSGDTVGSLASAVAAVELVTAGGALRTFRRGDPDFPGVVVSLGALGVVTTLELDIVPRFDIAQTVYEELPLDAALTGFSAITAAGYSVSLFTTWLDPDVIDQVWVKRTTETGPAPDTLSGARRATVKRHPLPGVDPEHCTDQLGVPGPWLARLPHFKLEYTPSSGDELQTEYLVPRQHAGDALRAVRALAGEIAPLLLVCEVRTVAGDDLWLSPAQGGGVVGIHFTWQPRQAEVEAVLPDIARALEPFAARPHWGKVFDADAAAPRLPGLYPQWDDFRSLRRALDPCGVFANAFLDRLGV
ncbi:MULTISPECIES: D-arabinono-1,4-lactone oxidase [Microbacterium]|uniref:FAD-binding protein n=1 Tax=Microbacterium wangchenii TaxID=2541726 RepID=A0ABX5SQN4_9MICO|nr:MULTISPECIES: D-arabinono-1,4-lactone oxidase [Microbacterium]MCK6068315.1 FAD-binding protein [Microbacterium sp. EYE_512]QBR87595.1 FAD-binding protein [Microbacterium wangchenii]TFV84324.1 FAD-binding protein [Microbacterium sp. dk485]TXK15863.1 FAD-binding protein [Microbacterium wangchenii]